MYAFVMTRSASLAALYVVAHLDCEMRKCVDVRLCSALRNETPDEFRLEKFRGLEPSRTAWYRLMAVRGVGKNGQAKVTKECVAVVIHKNVLLQAW